MKGGLRPVDFKENGTGRVVGRVTLDDTPTPIRAAFKRGLITHRQKDAAERYHWLVMITREIGGRRDSLDLTPRGSNEPSAGQLSRLIDRKQEVKLIDAMLSLEARAVVYSVAVLEESIGDARNRRCRVLLDALTDMADMWKMPEDEG